MGKYFLKFSAWIKLKEEPVVSVSGGGNVSIGGATSPSPTTSPTTDQPSGGGSTKTTDIAHKPSVVGCGYCYPFCGTNVEKKKKKKRSKKNK